MSWFDILFGFGNLLCAVVLFVSFRKALAMQDKTVRYEIASLLVFRSSFAPRKLKHEFQGLADLIVNRERCKAAADDVRRRYAAEAAKRKAP